MPKHEALIAHFGFSTHTNMIECLNAAARLDWIDVIMTSFNFRLMQDPKMIEAVDACHKAGIGLVAMKTTGKTTIDMGASGYGHRRRQKNGTAFRAEGLTPEQAAIKFVLDDQRISCACVGMSDMTVLTANLAAVLDKKEVAQADRHAFAGYAAATCDGYCAGCAHKCDEAMPDAPYVSEIMRYLMYHNSYGDKAMARSCSLDSTRRPEPPARYRLYRRRTRLSAQRMAIGKLINEAVTKLA